MQLPKRSRRLLALGLTLALLGSFILSPVFPFVRSLAVMGVYSGMHHRQSLMAEENIGLRIPGGLSTKQADWYPFVMTFVADGSYAAYTGEQGAKLTILYNFPAYSYARGCSRLYDTSSPYYNSFYGAYLVRDGSNEKLAAGMLEEETAANIAQFDFFSLVLGDFGLTTAESIFDFSVSESNENVSYVGYDGWTMIKADITVNGSAHNKRQAVTSYLQYGAPNFGPVEQEFVPVAMTGLMYGRYFPQWDVGLYFYVMGTNEEVCRACDEEILSKSTLNTPDA